MLRLRPPPGAAKIIESRFAPRGLGRRAALLQGRLEGVEDNRASSIAGRDARRSATILLLVLSRAPCPRCAGRGAQRGPLASVDILAQASLARASSWPPMPAGRRWDQRARARRAAAAGFGTPQRDVGGEFAGARRHHQRRGAKLALGAPGAETREAKLATLPLPLSCCFHFCAFAAACWPWPRVAPA